MAEHLFDQIVLLTHDFPYNTGFPTAESYLEHELPLLAEHAGEVVVIAHEFFNPDWSLRMELPSNVRAYGIQDARFFPQTAEEAARQRHGYALPPCKPILSDLRKILPSKDRLSAAIDFLQLADAKIAALDDLLNREGLHVGSGRTLLYSFWNNEPVFALFHLADAIEKRCGKRPVVVSRAHGYDCYDHRSELGYLPFKKYMGKRLDKVFACSADGAHFLASNNSGCADVFGVGYLGTVDCGLGPWSDFRQSGRPFNIVCCSRAVPLKRVDRVLDAMAALQASGRDVVLHYMGDGPELDALKAKAGELGLDNVVFMGALPNREVLEFYQCTQVDLFVNTSTTEGLPLSVMEAQSFGIPVLATDVGGEREIIDENLGNGVLIERDFADSDLVDAIESFIDMPESQMIGMRASARAVWEVKFDVRSNVELFLRQVLNFV